MDSPMSAIHDVHRSFLALYDRKLPTVTTDRTYPHTKSPGPQWYHCHTSLIQPIIMAPPPHVLQASSETSHGHYYLYGFTALLALGVVRYVYQTLTSPLRDVPGPFLARFTRLWELWAICKYETATLNIALHKRYGNERQLACFCRG
jgi:hypothetical protein